MLTQKEGIKESGIFYATGNFENIFLQKGHLRYIFAKDEINNNNIQVLQNSNLYLNQEFDNNLMPYIIEGTAKLN